MTDYQKKEIEQIAKKFTDGFKDTVGKIAGSGWLIIDPLSAYLNFCGYENALSQIPASKIHPQILIMTFKDGTQLIPSGSDMKFVIPEATDWLWT